MRWAEVVFLECFAVDDAERLCQRKPLDLLHGL